MGKVILYIATSLDGYIARADGAIDWLNKYEGGGEDYGYAEFIKNVGSVIVGGKTYRQVLGFDDGWSMPDVETVVITRQELDAPPGAPVRAYSGDMKALVDELKGRSDKDIWLMGGGEIIALFVRDRLIDEYMVFVVPVLLGEGIPLFPPGAHEDMTLKVIDVHRYNDGMVKLHYECCA